VDPRPDAFARADDCEFLLPGLVRGAEVCDNSTAAPAETLHASVAMSLREAFTPERFQQHLANLAGDAEAQARRTAARQRLIARAPQINQEESNITRAIAAGGALEPLVARLKELKAERELVESDLAELEADERDLRSRTEAVGRLQEQWTDWIMALDTAAEGTVAEATLQVAADSAEGAPHGHLRGARRPRRLDVLRRGQCGRSWSAGSRPLDARGGGGGLEPARRRPAVHRSGDRGRVR
jgi:hypothetical protein